MTGGNANVTRVLHVKRHEQCLKKKEECKGKVLPGNHTHTPKTHLFYGIAIPLHFLWGKQVLRWVLKPAHDVNRAKTPLIYFLSFLLIFFYSQKPTKHSLLF